MIINVPDETFKYWKENRGGIAPIAAFIDGVEIPDGHRICDLDETLVCLEEVADCDDKRYALWLLEWAMNKRSI